MYAQQPDDNNRRFMTEAEYLEFTANNEGRYEFANGEVFDMVGGSINHAEICSNLVRNLGNQLIDQNCSALTSDARIFIGKKIIYRYPDVTVYCGKREYLQEQTTTLLNPVLVIEVLSPSTEKKDRGEKFEDYTHIPSLQAYVLVSQHKPKIELFSRYKDGKWLYEVAEGLDANLTVSLENSDVTILLDDVYRRVEWENSDTDDTPPTTENDI